LTPGVASVLPSRWAEACTRANVCHQGLPAVQLLGQVLARVRRVVPFDASLWSTTDPATLLPTGGLMSRITLWVGQRIDPLNRRDGLRDSTGE
jgi:hypothetical protein